MKTFKLFLLPALAICVSAVVFYLGPNYMESAATSGQSGPPSEAPTGFDNKTNGYLTQAQFIAYKTSFDRRVKIEDGLGPVYNSDSCSGCHSAPVSGGSGDFIVLMSGHFDSVNYVDHPGGAGRAGGSLIRMHAINPDILERVSAGYEIRALRASLNTLGDGYIEAIDDSTIIAIAQKQPEQMRGEFIEVPIAESPGQTRIGRFGWKCQNASLLSFTSEAYLNEMGITNRLFPKETTSAGRMVAEYDNVPDPEDETDSVTGLSHIDKMANFIRSTKAPPPDARLQADPGAQMGSKLFEHIGCAICHVRTIFTAPPGTVINGGKFTVPPALGNKIIHPYSDFLLHDVGTGDGIVQYGGPSTRNKMRTPPLWGVRLRPMLMHDHASPNLENAILRHAEEASPVVKRYYALTGTQKAQILQFLKSL